MQNRPHLDVLEVQRQQVASIFLLGRIELRLLVLLLLGFLRRPHLDHIQIIGLIGQILERWVGPDVQAGGAAPVQRLHGRHRRGEISHIQSPLLAARQRRPRKIGDDLITLLAHVRRDVGIGQLDGDDALTIRPALKPDIAERARPAATHHRRLDVRRPLARRRLDRSHRRLRRGPRRGGARILQRQQHRIALHLHLVRHQPRQIQRRPGPVGPFQHADLVSHSDINRLLPGAQAIGSIQKIQHDPRRLIDGKAARRPLGWPRQLKPQLQAVAGQRTDIHRLQHHRPGLGGRQRRPPHPDQHDPPDQPQHRRPTR